MGTIDTDSLEKRDGPENDPTRTTNSPNYGSHLFTRDVGHTFMVVDAGNRALVQACLCTRSTRHCLCTSLHGRISNVSASDFCGLKLVRFARLCTVYPGKHNKVLTRTPFGPTTPDEATSSRPHVVLQSRRIKDVTPTNLESSVDDFLSGTWAEISQKFIYATSAPARSAQVIDKIEGLAKRLEQRSIAFEVWDQESISEKLKGHPELVDDFLGRPWVKAFCGDDAANRLGKRLDVQDMAKLRRELARVYANTFGLADPGFVAFWVE